MRLTRSAFRNRPRAGTREIAKTETPGTADRVTGMARLMIDTSLVRGATIGMIDRITATDEMMVRIIAIGDAGVGASRVESAPIQEDTTDAFGQTVRADRRIVINRRDVRLLPKQRPFRTTPLCTLRDRYLRCR